MSTIYGNTVGGAGLTQTYILQYPNGREVTAVVSDEPISLTANENDIREGKTAATEKGVVTGKKVIPAYHTNKGVIVIPSGNEFKITLLKDLDTYDYTKLEAMICDFNTSLADSVATDKVVIDDHVYAVQSTNSLSVLTKNDTDKTVDFGITNETSKMQILRFFTYKEIN